eukprot:TRINITY_DN9890_c0_g1_i10.p1 TRINITY_DN9890_c0_g1~~TRINITY_DN9890_c0_g1_i10.p1  ORF type:complete len:804 (-),score=133.22 TRINITY_DN9890_c0_g1_i10:707-3118(-)
MEKLKSVVPPDLKQMISESTPDNLPNTCSLLLDFFLHLPQFHQVVQDLTNREMGLCSKNMTSASDSKRKGNECFSKGDFSEALRFYSQALRLAPMDGDDMDKDFVAMVYVNRATTMHNMGLFNECTRDCNRAVLLSPCYVKAWYRRGKANASLENYEDAVHDLNVALSLENSLSKKIGVIDELKTLLNRCKRASGTNNSHSKDNEKDLGSFVEPDEVRLQCVSTPAKGRGMTSSSNIPPACLIHSEEPYAAIILKHCRETHCHFCFNELPADSIPCSSCTIPVYCSQHCQERAGGVRSRGNQHSDTKFENIAVDLQKYVASINLSGGTEVDANLGAIGKEIAEHRHECGGIHWSAVLPPEIVLAGRILAKSIETRRCLGETFTHVEDLDLCHNYTCIASESKLELHIYSVVLAYCLQHSYGVEFPLVGSSASQLVILLAQIKVNSMAVVHMKSSDTYMTLEQSGGLSGTENSLTSNIEQVSVGQAIYLTGSLFNQSCRPNIHAYFLSRKLFIRSTEFVAESCPLELSYGPQVGQWDIYYRQQLLEDQYSFKCHCSGCSEQNLSDLVIHAFRCVNPDCFGAVLPCHTILHEKLDDNCLQNVTAINILDRPMPVQKQEREAISEVAHLLLEHTSGILKIGPGYCLSCGTHCDLEASHATLRKAGKAIKRLQDKLILKKVSTTVLSDALKSLTLLKSVMHAYSKDIAQAEDNLAEAFCLIGEFQAAVHHCKASLEIIKRLYPTNHIAIGNELMKLASIQLSLNDRASALNSIKQAYTIFSLHYGSHMVMLFPYLENLQREAKKFVL